MLTSDISIAAIIDVISCLASSTLFRIKVRRTSFPKLSPCLIREDEGIADDGPAFNHDVCEIFRQREDFPMRSSSSSPSSSRRVCLLEEKQTWLEVGMIQWVSRDRCEMSPEVLPKISSLEEAEATSDCSFYVWLILGLCRCSFLFACTAVVWINDVMIRASMRGWQQRERGERRGKSIKTEKKSSNSSCFFHLSFALLYSITHPCRRVTIGSRSYRVPKWCRLLSTITCKDDEDE